MENKYGLTFPQKNILLVEEFFGKSPINTIVGIFEINKEFDKEVCEKAVNKMVEVNDALRLKIFKENDNTYQYVEKYNYFNVDYFDLENESDLKRKELEKELTTKPFEILNSPLYYFAIVKTEKDKGHIFVKLHHLVSDAWTFGNVATQLAEYVDMYTKGEDNEILKPSYLEFISSENEYISSEKFTKDKMFWEEYLEGFEEVVGLKENNNKTLIDAKRYTVRLEEKLNSDIKEFCKENKVSPYTVFMNALAIYLHRVTEKYDFVIGTPVLNRSNFKEKKMMGMFVSTMPVRFKIDEKETFLEMCKKSSSETMSLFRHQKYPYSLMLQDFRGKNNVSNNLYEVMISYQNARAEYSDNEKYSSDWMFSTKVQDQFAIHIMDMDETGVLEVHFDYLVDLFEDIEIEYISKRLFTIIDDGINNNKTIENIEIMPEEEKNKILYEFNNTKVDYPKDKTVIDLFEEQVQKTPDNVAIVFEGKELTYKELNDKANSLAWYLKKYNINSGDMVGILIDKSFELIISILALLKLGVCYVPLEKNYTLERKEFILKNAGCRNVIVDEKEEVSINQINITGIELKSNIKKVVNENNPDSSNCVLYTSGTTGEPKGAVIVDRNIVKLVKDADYITFEETDSILQAASTSFDVSLFEIWGALLNGATLHVIKKINLINPSYLKKYLISNNISILWITSALFNQMIEVDAVMFCKLRRIFTGGDVISIKHVNMLKDSCPNLLITNCYGPTECVAFTNTYNIYEKVTKKVPLGPAISNTTGYVIDSKNRLLPLYVQGEYIIGGESVGLEYINNNELTSQKFIHNYIDNKFEIDRLYKTGDIVQMIDGGNIDFIGRKDNQIKIRGYRIELDEIKVAMQSYGNVKDAVAIVKTNNNNKQIYAYYTSQIIEDNNKFIEYLKNKLPIYMIPSRMLQLDFIPINQNGKIDRKKLPEIKIELAEKQYDISKYEGVYKIIYNVFSKITGVENISPADSFFDIGGDSISVIKIISELSKENLNVTFQDIYKYPSIKELGNMLYKCEKSESISEHLYSEDYTKINELLSNNTIDEMINKNIVTHNGKNILLTGATGFLGAHILYKYLEKYDNVKVYCLVRRKDDLDPDKRLKEKLVYFFGKEYVESVESRIIVIEGDTIKEGIFNSVDDKELVASDIDIIINSAAHVKHFGDLELFDKINTQSVKILAEFALKYNKKFIQISTLSVSGNILENGQIEQKHIKPGTVFNENKLFIGQNLDNVYAYTKFMGEMIVYDYIINKGLDAKVIRMGNLTGRFLDGKFQPNAEENAFAQRIRTIIELGVLPNNLLDFDVEFTPIDYAAEATVTLLNTDNKYNTFHLFNDNHIKMEELNRIFKEVGIDLKVITKLEMTELMKKLINNDYSKIQGIVQDLNSNKELDYKPNTKIKEDFTKYVLEKSGFKWPVIDDVYIKKYLKNLYDIRFLKENK